MSCHADKIFKPFNVCSKNKEDTWKSLEDIVMTRLENPRSFIMSALGDGLENLVIFDANPRESLDNKRDEHAGVD